MKWVGTFARTQAYAFIDFLVDVTTIAGNEIGREVAFYAGCVASWISIYNSFPDIQFTAR